LEGPLPLCPQLGTTPLHETEILVENGAKSNSVQRVGTWSTVRSVPSGVSHQVAHQLADWSRRPHKPSQIGEFLTQRWYSTFQQVFQHFPGTILRSGSRIFQDRVFKCQRGKLTILQANTMNNRPSCYSTDHWHTVTLYHNHIICTSRWKLSTTDQISPKPNEQSIKTATVK